MQTNLYIPISITRVALTLVSVVASPGETVATPALQLFILRICGGVFALNCLLETKQDLFENTVIH